MHLLVSTIRTTPYSSKRFPLLQNRPNQLWVPPSLLRNESRCSFPDIKRMVLETDQSLPSSSKVKNEWPFSVALHVRLRGIDRDKFTFSVISTDDEF